MLYDILLSVETMERIPLSNLPDKPDELSARIDKKNIGFVLTADDKDKYVLSQCVIENEIEILFDYDKQQRLIFR